jgi:hypothetical protein
MRGAPSRPEYGAFPYAFFRGSDVRSENLNLTEYSSCVLEAGVGIATGHVLDGPGSIVGSVRFVFAPQHPNPLWGVLPDFHPMGTAGSFPRRCEAKD